MACASSPAGTIPLSKRFREKLVQVEQSADCLPKGVYA